MSGNLKDAIADLLARHGSPARQIIEPAILRLARKLPEGIGDLRSANKDYDAISVVLVDSLSRGEQLTGRQARDGAWCLWTTKAAIAERAETLKPFLEQLRDLKHQRALSSPRAVISHQLPRRSSRPLCCGRRAAGLGHRHGRAVRRAASKIPHLRRDRRAPAYR